MSNEARHLRLVVTDAPEGGHVGDVGSAATIALPQGASPAPRPSHTFSLSATGPAVAGVAATGSSAASSAGRPAGSPGASPGGGLFTPPKFEVVYDEWFDFVWRSARRLGVAESSVDDVVQEVFLVVHRRLPDFEGRSSVKTWLFAIVLRVVSDYRRTLRRKGGLSELPDEPIDDRSASPAAEAERAQAVRLLHQLLDELDDDKRTVFVLAELEQMSAPEISEIVGCPLNTVYSRLRAAREAFERALSRYRAREASVRRKP